MREAHDISALDRVTTWGLCALVTVAPLAIGGTRADVQLALSGAAVALLILTAYACLARRIRIPWPAWGPILLVGLGLLQLLPLPAEWLATLTPKAHEIRQVSLGDLGLYGAGTRHPISLDPPATWLATLNQAGFAAVLLTALNVPAAERIRVVRVLALGAGLVALIGMAQWLTGAEQILWWYQPRDRLQLAGFFSTFVNNNTLAGYLVLGTLVALGSACHTESPQRRVVMGATAGLAALGAVLSGSRGGQVALLTGLAIFGALAYARSDSDLDPRRQRARRAAIGGGLLAGTALALAIWFQPEWTSLLGGDTADEKVVAWLAAGDYVSDFAAVGSGRGAFAYVFPLYQDHSLSRAVTHPENIVLQLACEWGLAGAAIALLCGVGAFFYAITAVGRAPRPRHWGLLAGLAAVGLQQLADFGFEAAGLSLPVAAALGVVLAEPRRGPRRRRVPAALVLVPALALGLLTAWRGPEAVAAQADAAIADLHAAERDVVERARAHAVAHPADHLVAYAAARRLAETGEADLSTVMRWINRALYLHPTGGDAHLLAARVLARNGRAAQAAVEYRLALEAMPWREGALIREAAGALGSPGDLARAVPATSRARLRLGNVLLEQGRPADLRRLADDLAFAAPDDADVRELRARACAALKDVGCAEAEAAWLIAHRRPMVGHGLKALLAASRGDAEAAHAALAAMGDASRRDASALRLAVDVHVRLRDVAAAREAVDALWRVAADDAESAAALATQGHVEARIGEPEAALRAYEQALALNPRPAYAAAAVRVARKLGRHDHARRVLHDAHRRWPTAPQLKGLAEAGESEAPAAPVDD